MPGISDADLLAAAIDVPGRLVLGPTSIAAGFPYGGQPIGVRTEAKLEWVGRYQVIRDPMTGAILRVIRREVEQPRLGFLLEPPWDQNALLAAFNAAVPSLDLPFPTPPETAIEGSWAPVAEVSALSAPLLFAPLDPRQLAIYFLIPIPLLTFGEAIALSAEEEAGLPFVFEPALSVDSSDPGFPYVGTLPPWKLSRLENLVLA